MFWLFSSHQSSQISQQSRVVSCLHGDRRKQSPIVITTQELALLACEHLVWEKLLPTLLSHSASFCVHRQVMSRKGSSDNSLPLLPPTKQSPSPPAAFTSPGTTATDFLVCLSLSLSLPAFNCDYKPQLTRSAKLQVCMSRYCDLQHRG